MVSSFVVEVVNLLKHRAINARIAIRRQPHHLVLIEERVTEQLNRGSIEDPERHTLREGVQRSQRPAFPGVYRHRLGLTLTVEHYNQRAWKPGVIVRAAGMRQMVLDENDSVRADRVPQRLPEQLLQELAGTSNWQV